MRGLVGEPKGLVDPMAPMGLMGCEFVEFASPVANTLEPVFEQLGFSLVARHRSKDVLLYRQGAMNIVVNTHAGVLRPTGGGDVAEAPLHRENLRIFVSPHCVRTAVLR